ncbi:MAG TPA: hypothetical protein VFC33_09885 [Acidimicrobiia bacterium]|nr:hypothetical protein [Acidimicrobiia bacterium]
MTVHEAADGLRATVDRDGTVRIGWGEDHDWFGPATPPALDGIRCDVTADPDRAVVVFTIEATRDLAGIATGTFADASVPWPWFRPRDRAPGGQPEGTRAFGFQYSEFCFPAHAGGDLAGWRLLPHRPAVVWPLWLRGPDGRTLLLAPLDYFHEHVVGVQAAGDDVDRGLRCGWHGDLDRVPAGFTTHLAVWAGPGPRACLDAWAADIRRQNATVRPGRDADALSRRPSYWTDNGSAYWYRTDRGRTIAQTLAAAVDDLRARDVPFDAVQLDSWWYPHEVLRPFDTEEWEVPPSGLVRWEARDDVLPDGVTGLRHALGDPPLVTHCRHLSASSPYVDELPCWVDGDRAHPKGPQLYERWLDQCVAWGVETFEHDWLVEAYLGVRGLREVPGRARAWQEGIDAAAGERGMTLQWCMASPADFCQTATLRNVTSIRTSGDHGYIAWPGMLWAWFLWVNAFARALGLRPYKDVFHADTSDAGAHSEVEALLSALSTGPVGFGDAIGRADPGLVRRTCRADGVLVKPDVPVAALDRSFTRGVLSGRRLLVGETSTRHGDETWRYVVALNAGAAGEPVRERVTLDELGVDGPAVVWDWRARRGAVVGAGGGWDVELGPHGWDYRVVAPVLAGRVAVVGDAELFVPAGDRRIADVTAEGVVTVSGAPGETVTVTGWDVERDTPVTATLTLPDRGWTRIEL